MLSDTLAYQDHHFIFSFLFFFFFTVIYCFDAMALSLPMHVPNLSNICPEHFEMRKNSLNYDKNTPHVKQPTKEHIHGKFHELNFENICRIENIKKCPNSSLFLMLWTGSLTHDLEQWINSGNYHYLCLFQTWELSVHRILSYHVHTIYMSGNGQRAGGSFNIQLYPHIHETHYILQSFGYKDIIPSSL